MAGVAGWFSKMFGKFFIKLLPILIILNFLSPEEAEEIVGGDDEEEVLPID